jgi:YD repeat-containing protein
VGPTEINRDAAFDDDRLATKTGPFTISRSGPIGAVSKISDGKLALTYGYDGNGRPTARTLSVGGTEKYYSKLTFANTGRAGSREERVDGGALDTLTYGYDGSGQLLTVKRGTTVLENHTYDLNGNRQDAGAVYDDQDRLTSLNGVSYEWDADGFLRKRGNDTFTWSKTGDLLSAGATSYKYDGFGRRVAAGNTTFLYGNPANAFQVTASVRDGVVTTYYYDADDRLFALERGGERYYVGSDAVGSPRVVALRRVRRRHPDLPRQRLGRPLVGLLGVRARRRRRRRGRPRLGGAGRQHHRVRRGERQARWRGRHDRRPDRPAVHEHERLGQGHGRRLPGGDRHHRRRLRRLGPERPADPRLQDRGEGRAEGVQEVLSSTSSM